MLNAAVELAGSAEGDPAWTDFRWGQLLTVAGVVMRPAAVTTVLVALLLIAVARGLRRMRRVGSSPSAESPPATDRATSLSAR
jgi:hypothetical protein